MELETVRSQLRAAARKKITYNEKDDHCTINSIRRGVPKTEVEGNLLNPENLRFVVKEKGRHEGEQKYTLYFETSKNRTIVLPVIISNKDIYVITIIKKWRKWEGVVTKWRKKLPR